MNGHQLLALCLVCSTFQLARADGDRADDLVGLNEKAMKAAVLQAAPSVVQIETSGGTDTVGSGPGTQAIRKGVGPTTGLIVGADGFVVSSAFNFANKPSAIFVSIPGHRERYPASVVATDQTRMLTLLKITATGLPVLIPSPKKDLRVGQWAVALGRTWTSPEQLPSVSVGIISALGRIWGKAVQTDAKISPVNYGGPLLDIKGRVIGVLVPASPRGQDETAGIEWYDSGIGFAIPLEDVNAVLPRLKAGQDLKRGMLGISVKSTDMYGAIPVVEATAPESTAAKAGITAGDVIVKIDDTLITRQAQILHQLGNKYEGDTVTVTIKRNGKEIVLPNLKLASPLTTLAYPFLGILPLRDDSEKGEVVRFVYPKSPAETAGIKPGDRLLKIGGRSGDLKPITGRDQLTTILSAAPPGGDVRVEIKRKDGGKTETLALKLGTMPDTVPERLPEPASLKKALAVKTPVAPAEEEKDDQPDENKDEKKEEPKPAEPKKEPKPEPKKKAETGVIKRTDQAGDHKYWVYVPETYDPNVAHAVLVWLHPTGKGKDKDLDAMIDTWALDCAERHMILILPIAESDTGWISSEAEFVQGVVREVADQYTVDRQRIVAHGMGVGGEMALYLGFSARDLIRGVATTGTPLRGQPKENLAAKRLSFFLVAGGKDPLVKAIAEGKTKLSERKFPVVYREIADMGHQYLDEKTLLELVRWIDTLDRQ